MAISLPSEPARPEAPHVPSATAELLEGMSEEEAALALGLGLLVQRAAEVEYILHGLYAHLNGVERPYTDKPHETVKHFITKAKSRLAAIPGEQIPAHARAALLHDLDLCMTGFAQRNKYIHSCWQYDEEVHGWRIIKGTKNLSRPEFGLVSSEDVWDLASEFARLRDKLVVWDAHFFGTPDDPELGTPAASSKRL